MDWSAIAQSVARNSLLFSSSSMVDSFAYCSTCSNADNYERAGTFERKDMYRWKTIS